MLKTEEKKAEKVIYKLTGRVGYWISPHNDPDYFNGPRLEKDIVASSDTEARKEAHELIAAFLKEHPDLDPRKQQAGDNRKFQFNFWLTKPVMTIHYVRGKPGRLAVPAEPAVEAHIEEINS